MTKKTQELRLKALLYKTTLMFFSLYCLLTSCNKCPPDVKLGEIYLTNQSINAFPYNNVKDLYFINERGVSKRFRSLDGKQVEEYHLINSEFCGSPGFPFPLTAVEYYLSEKMVIEFSSNTNNEKLTVELRVSDANLIEWYSHGNPAVDGLFIGLLLSNNRGISAKLMFDDRNSSFNPEELDIFPTHYFVEDTVFLGRSFQNVSWVNTNDGLNALFCTKEQGLVAFIDHQQVFWVLDRIE
jgi:hypothetical protein